MQGKEDTDRYMDIDISVDISSSISYNLDLHTSRQIYASVCTQN